MPEKYEKPGGLFTTVAALICLLLAVTYALSGAFARYVTTTDGGSSAHVARFAFLTDGTEQFTGFDMSDLAPGEQAVYTFTVANHNDKGICEVKLQYVIRFEDFDNLPLVYTLAKNGVNIPMTDLNTAAPQILLPGASQTDTYTLTVSWPEEENDASYSKLLDAIKMIIITEQVD